MDKDELKEIKKRKIKKVREQEKINK